jgi:hypothetical protein
MESREATNMITVHDIVFDSSKHYDIAIACCGYEERSSFVCRQGLQGSAKMALDYEDVGLGSADSNRRLYRELKWNLTSIDNAWAEIRTLIETFTTSPEQPVSLCVDISSMKRKTISGIIELLILCKKKLTVDFIYCPACYDENSKAAEIRETLTAEPMSEFFVGDRRPSDIPLALIMGIGLKKQRVNGLISTLEPADTWLFMAINGDPRYEKEEERLHGNIMLQDGVRLCHYDVQSLCSTYYSLESLCFATSIDYRTLLAPSGPKIFTLACLLVSATTGSLRPAVWRIGDSASGARVDVKELGITVSSRVEFVADGTMNLANII